MRVSSANVYSLRSPYRHLAQLKSLIMPHPPETSPPKHHTTDPKPPKMSDSNNPELTQLLTTLTKQNEEILKSLTDLNKGKEVSKEEAKSDKPKKPTCYEDFPPEQRKIEIAKDKKRGTTDADREKMYHWLRARGMSQVDSEHIVGKQTSWPY